ncbi:hypothetical protein HAX54_053204 [Datura stramonium]|uniref:Uncharacterized protein n=1 Tax=Datura stramonium TaxID=4076 RepID=A0ABS8T108_DATST|nr:hypothetical protein [Datura stramonium]
MGISDPELFIVISGRYPMSFTTIEFPIYGETRIYDDDSLASFLESPNTFSNHISIPMLDIRQPNVIRNSGIQYEGGVEMHIDNFVMQNHDIGGPSNPPTELQNLYLSDGYPTPTNPIESLER